MFRIPPNFLSKGYVEFEVSLQVSTNITSNVRFTDSDFAVSIVVYEEDYEDSNDTLLARQSLENRQINILIIIFQIIIIHNGKN